MNEILGDPDLIALRNSGGRRTLRYIGKPNRYRALEAQRFLQRQPGEVLENALEVEFDSGGIIFSRWNGDTWSAYVHTAYHPHSGGLGPIDGFSRHVYPKRVGGMTLYSYKDRLSVDELDAFYAWYEKAFKRKLQRPRGKAARMAGEKALKPLPAPEPAPILRECTCTEDWVDARCPRHGWI